MSSVSLLSVATHTHTHIGESHLHLRMRKRNENESVCRVSLTLSSLSSMQMADEKNTHMCSICLQDLKENPCPQCGTDPNDSVDSVAEELEKMGFQTCDSGAGKKEKAVKTCLVCLASYCEAHLQMHNDLYAGNTHLLVDDVTGNLRDKMCGEHQRLLEVYCRTDGQCICCFCMLDMKHKGHDMVCVATERAEKQVKCVSLMINNWYDN